MGYFGDSFRSVKLLKFIILSLFLFWIELLGNEAPGAIFLSISPGAKAVSMGSAFTALCDDPSSLYYNPGALGLNNRSEFLIMNQGLPPGIGRFFEERLLDFARHHLYKNSSISPEPEWLPGLHQGMRYIYSAGVIPFNKIGNFGFNYTYLTTGVTRVIGPDGTYLGSYESYDYAVGLSYGKEIFDRFGLGMTAKYIHSFLFPDWVRELIEVEGSRIGKDEIGRAIAIDLGTLYKIWGCGFGVSFQNYGSRIKYSSNSSNRLPTRIRWGIVLDPTVALDSLLAIYKLTPHSISSIFDVKFAYDVSYDQKDFEDVWKSQGWEFTLFRFLSYRRGKFRDELGWRTGSTNGVGLNFRNIRIDIATDRGIYSFPTENWRVQIILNAVKPPEKIINNKRLNSLLTITSSSLFPGGGQFYKGEGIKGSIFFAPSLYLGNCYLTSDSKSTKTWSLIGLCALYIFSAAESLLH